MAPRQVARLVASLAVMAAAVTIMSSPVAAAEPAGGDRSVAVTTAVEATPHMVNPWLRIRNLWSERCIDTSSGTARIWDCGWSSYQHYRWEPGGLIMNQYWECLEAPPSNGYPVRVDYCGSTRFQAWHPEPVVYNGRQMYLLQRMGTNKCMDVRDWGWANGTIVQVWECDRNKTNQLFYYDNVHW